MAAVVGTLATNVNQQNIKASPAVDTSQWKKENRKTQEKLDANKH